MSDSETSNDENFPRAEIDDDSSVEAEIPKEIEKPKPIPCDVKPKRERTEKQKAIGVEVSTGTSTSKAIEKVMKIYKPRLRKIFAHFSAKNSSIMDVREFLYMLRELNVVDNHNLTMRAVSKLVVASISFVGDLERDQLDFDQFVDVLARCAELKTYDGIV